MPNDFRDQVVRGATPQIILWLERTPTSRLPWHDHEGGSVTNVGDFYLSTERVAVVGGEVPPFYWVKVCDRYDVTAWQVTRERGLIDGGRAAERSSAATLAEAKGWAERALFVLAIDSLAYDWRAWSFVLAVLAGHLPCPTPAATLRAALSPP